MKENKSKSFCLLKLFSLLLERVTNNHHFHLKHSHCVRLIPFFCNGKITATSAPPQISHPSNSQQRVQSSCLGGNLLGKKMYKKITPSLAGSITYPLLFFPLTPLPLPTHTHSLINGPGGPRLCRQSQEETFTSEALFPIRMQLQSYWRRTPFHKGIL